MITSICVTKKCPDAILVENFSSKSVIQLLFKVFFKSAHPKKIQIILVDLSPVCLQLKFSVSLVSKRVIYLFVFLRGVRSNGYLDSEARLKEIVLRKRLELEEYLIFALIILMKVSHERMSFSPCEIAQVKILRTPHNHGRSQDFH